MPHVPLRAVVLRSIAFACALGLLTAAPASAADRLGVDLGVVGVDVSPGGANVNIDAPGVANADVNAGGSGVRVGANVGGNQLDVDVPVPSTPTPPPVDPGGAVGGAVGGAQDTVNDVVSGTGLGSGSNGGGGGGSDPAASAATNNGSGGGSNRSSGPASRSGRQTGSSGSGGGDDGRGSGSAGRGGDRGGRGDSGGSDGRGSPDGGSGGGADGGSGGKVDATRTSTSTGADTSGDDGSGVTGTLSTVVEVIPTPIWILMFVLGGLAALFFGRSTVVGRRARRLGKQREELLKDVGLLQQALLPEIPEKLGELATSVAYRPANGPAAGGDFYDAFLLDGERVAIIVGDVSGHGRAALARTALMRYTLRAYLDAGLEPRRALKVAGKALDDDLGGDFATVVLAVHDPAHATLTYASAGHPPPIVTGSGPFEPVTTLSSPPIGAGLPTGQRQTTLHLPGDAIACFFTDGLIEAKHDGELVGREKLCEMLADLGSHATAAGVIDAVAFYADATPDDMAACVLRPDATAGADHVPDRLEEVELTALDLAGDRVERFLAACGVDPDQAAAALKTVEAGVGEFGCALLRVRVDKAGARVEVESAAGLHDPLGAPPAMDDAPVSA
jgi:hypothetical protein